jgi:hypothetical protein
MVCLKCVVVNTLHKGDNKDNNSDIFKLSALIEKILSSKNVNFSCIGANVTFPLSHIIITTDRVVKQI